jgi:hypothetical protein
MTLLAPQPCETHCRTQFGKLCRLIVRCLDSYTERRFCLSFLCRTAHQQQLTVQPIKFRFGRSLASVGRDLPAFSDDPEFLLGCFAAKYAKAKLAYCQVGTTAPVAA